MTNARLIQPVLVSAAAQLTVSAARPAISYRGLALDLGPTEIGVLAALYAVLPIFAALLLGRAVGHARRLMVVPGVSSAILAVSCVIGAFAGDFWGLAAASALLGLGLLGVLLGTQNWITAITAEERFDQGFGWLTTGMAVGQTVGPLAGGFAISLFDADLSGGSAAALLVSAAAAALGGAASLSRRRAHSTDHARSASRGAWRRILASPGVALAIFAGTTLVTTVDILAAYLPLLAQERGISADVVGVLLGIRALASVASRMTIPMLTRRFHRSGLIVASTAGTAMMLIVVAVAPGAGLLGIALAIGGLFLGLGQPLSMSSIALAVPPRLRASALAMRLSGNRIAQVLLPLAAGAGAGVWGVGTVLWLQFTTVATASIWGMLAGSTDRRFE